MAYNRPLPNDPFFAGRVTDSDLAQQQRLARPRSLPAALPLHQGPGTAQLPPPQSLQMTDLAAALPEALEPSVLMRHLMIRRAAQQAQELQSLQDALLNEAGTKSFQQQLQQEQLQQRYHSMLQHRQAQAAALLEQYQQSPVPSPGGQSRSLLQHRQAAALLEQYQQSPVPVQGLDLLRSVSLAQQQRQERQHQQQHQQRMQLGLPPLGSLDPGSFLALSPNQAPATRLTAGDLSMLPRAPFSMDSTLPAPASPTSPSSQSLYSPSSGSTTGKNTVKLFVDDIREWDVLCGRGGRSNHHPGNKRYRHVVSDMKASYRTTEAKARKTDLSRAIVEHVCQYGGRFLKKDSATNRYYVLTKAEARKKTSQALRETKQLKWTL